MPNLMEVHTPERQEEKPEPMRFPAPPIQYWPRPFTFYPLNSAQWSFSVYPVAQFNIPLFYVYDPTAVSAEHAHVADGTKEEYTGNSPYVLDKNEESGVELIHKLQQENKSRSRSPSPARKADDERVTQSSRVRSMSPPSPNARALSTFS